MFCFYSKQSYAELHDISFPILDINCKSVAAMTVSVLARIDSENKRLKAMLKLNLGKRAANLSNKIALGNTENGI